MNTCYLEEEEVKTGVHRIWASFPHLSFTGKLQRAIKFIENLVCGNPKSEDTRRWNLGCWYKGRSLTSKMIP
jgi:hypothetical protein